MDRYKVVTAFGYSETMKMNMEVPRREQKLLKNPAKIAQGTTPMTQFLSYALMAALVELLAWRGGRRKKVIVITRITLGQQVAGTAELLAVSNRLRNSSLYSTVDTAHPYGTVN